jgi:hypothetical protein
MKNLYIIPTDKPSRLGLHQNNKLNLHDDVIALNPPHFRPQNIYITSDEEIKEGDWYLDTFNNQRIKANEFSDHKHYVNACKKIILTTDQDLINDGVQGIDDEFLEWFVKNPSCEVVEVFKERHHGVEFINDYPKGFFDYKIIIPQEEPKQETLEEAAEFWDAKQTILEFGKTYSSTDRPFAKAFIEGAEWQAERMYSEEEVMKLVDGAFHMYASSHRHDAKEWLVEQFKKK